MLATSAVNPYKQLQFPRFSKRLGQQLATVILNAQHRISVVMNQL
jgi:hypothetical protein